MVTVSGTARSVSAWLLTALVAGVVHATPLVSPADGSDAILTLRRDAQRELRLAYKIERPGEPDESVTLGLSTDYHYRKSDSRGLSIVDYRLKRIFSVPKENNTVINNSLYADAWYRGAELVNRANINEMLAKAGVNAPQGFHPQEPYWAETELGVITPKFQRPDLHREDSNGRIRWSLGNDEVVAVRYRAESVPVDLQRGLRRWWPSIASIHPAIADELARSGKVPAELWVKELAHGKNLVSAHWTLTDDRVIDSAPYPLPGRLTAAPTESSATYRQMFEVLSKTVAEKRAPLPQETYIARAQSAIGKGAGLEALVWTIEMKLASGVEEPCSSVSEVDHCALAARAGPLARADSRTAVAFAAHSPDAADRAQFDSLPNAYLLRLLWATRPSGKGVKREDAEHDLLVALSTSPIANFCKDTGDFYAAGWQSFAAWQVWDLGRMMANHRSGDLLDQIDKVEASVESAEPSLF
jgi:hypothetical protein